ncbi:hypothetical protein EZ313_00375 [Ramlibacter henchirensis]|uniref:Uncharacterized protein n=1 Tax=Ramlibacter henchirensis TaxID=204072 RepID=A0A4Z0C0W8_9BURK|nr:hypothetical protein [Ramlibacter henchirensis]TFZ05173.1 hypothetical protein EZ313_00375 [Ramlibacter henchirensis]
MQPPTPPDRPHGRIRRFAARWAGVLVAALVLLALSQALWWWETWPVRRLLDAPAAGGGQG